MNLSIYQDFILLFVLYNVVLQESYTSIRRCSTGVLFIFIFILSLFVAYRPSTLPDYINYYNFYYGIGTEDRFERGIKVIKSISPKFTIFLLFSALFSITIKLHSIRRLSKYMLLSIISYMTTSFVVHDMIQIRVSIAIAVFWYSIQFLIEKKFIKYAFCVLLASFFHYSALIMIVLPVFYKKTYNTFFWLGLVVISYGISFLGINLLNLVARFLPEKGYILATISSHQESWVNVFGINQLLRLSLFIILSICYKRIDTNMLVILKIFGISVIMVPLFSSMPLISGRLSEFFGTAIAFLLPELFSVFKNKAFSYWIFMVYILGFIFINIIHTVYIW